MNKANAHLQWDSLRYFLALYRHGRLVSAGKSLNVDHTTVGRRVRELEAALNTQLFEKREAGFCVTTAGVSLLNYAETIENTILRLKEHVGDGNLDLHGTVRISSPEAFDSYYLTSQLPELLNQYPQLEIELVGTNHHSNLSRREVDLLITSAKPKDESLVAKRLTDYSLGLFASKHYLESHKKINSIDDLSHHKLIAYSFHMQALEDDSLKNIIEPCNKTAFCSTSITAQHKSAQLGQGLCLLPHFITGDDNLIAILPEEINATRSLWMVMNQEARHSHRIKKVYDFIGERMITDKNVFIR